MGYKLKFWAGIITAVIVVGGAIGGIVSKYGAFQWITRKEATRAKETDAAREEKQDGKIMQNREDIIGMKGSIEKIDERTLNMQTMQRQLLKELRGW